jgi:hypothetical protein
MKRNVLSLAITLSSLTLLLFVSPLPASAAAVRFTVSATQGWQEVLTFHEGEGLRIDYKYGAWTVDYRNFPYVGPEGYSSNVDGTIFQGCKLVQDEHYGYLLGWVGKDAQTGTLLRVGGGGGQFYVTISEGDHLFLRINDDNECLGDNMGGVTVVATTIAAAR